MPTGFIKINYAKYLPEVTGQPKTRMRSIKNLPNSIITTLIVGFSRFRNEPDQIDPALLSTFLYSVGIWDAFTGVEKYEKYRKWWNAFGITAEVYLWDTGLLSNKKILTIRFVGTHREGKADTHAIIDLRDKIIHDERPDGVLIDFTQMTGYTSADTWSQPMPDIFHAKMGGVDIPIAVTVVGDKEHYHEIMQSIIEVGENDMLQNEQFTRLFMRFDKAQNYLINNIRATSQNG